MDRALPHEARFETITFPHILAFLETRSKTKREAKAYLKDRITTQLNKSGRMPTRTIRDLLSYFFGIDDYHDDDNWERLKDGVGEKKRIAKLLCLLPIRENKSSYLYNGSTGTKLSQHESIEEAMLWNYWKLTGDVRLREKIENMYNDKVKRPGLPRNLTVMKIIQILKKIRDGTHTDRNVVTYNNQLFKVLNWDNTTRKEFLLFCIERYKVVNSTIENIILPQ